MAERLLHAGFDVLGFDIRPADEFGAFGARMVADPATFAHQVDVVLSVVRDARQSHDLLFGEQALLVQPNHPSVVVTCSTLSPRYVRRLAERMPAGVRFMDAPMSGAPFRARSGELSFMLGGDSTLVGEMRPLFDAMGREIHHLGPLGHGMTVKVLNNYCAAASVVATRRVLALAQALDVETDRLLTVMRTSSGGNWYANNIDSIDWSGEGYSPDNTIGILEKDVHSALDAVGGSTEPVGDTFRRLDAAVLAALADLPPLKRN
jgi:3-hydroxyisobutyrate dehydrogenase-like beta-hydroxyacid dehydrogenase